MNKRVCFCLFLVLMLTAASALASGIGRVIPDPVLDLTYLIGKDVEAYHSLLAANSGKDASDVLLIEEDGVIAGFYLYDPGFSLCGYEVNGREPVGLTEKMEAEGWTTTQDQYEGGLRFHTFVWEEYGAVFTFRIHSSDYVITSVSLKAESAKPQVQDDPEQAKKLFRQGYAYEMGRDVEKDPVKAMECYLRAVELGSGDACTRIGLLYRDGAGVEMNYDEAIRWFYQGDEMGDEEAMFYLAEMYRTGRGVEHSYETALYWYEYAAERGSHKAQYVAGQYYYDGKIVPQNLERARELLMMGGDQKVPGAVELLKKMDQEAGK